MFNGGNKRHFNKAHFQRCNRYTTKLSVRFLLELSELSESHTGPQLQPKMFLRCQCFCAWLTNTRLTDHLELQGKKNRSQQHWGCCANGGSLRLLENVFCSHKNNSIWIGWHWRPSAKLKGCDKTFMDIWQPQIGYLGKGLSKIIQRGNTGLFLLLFLALLFYIIYHPFFFFVFFLLLTFYFKWIFFSCSDHDWMIYVYMFCYVKVLKIK